MGNRACSTYNARSLTPGQVAESFVPGDQFYQLLGDEHALLLGPRGSGKTTLLKMLTPEALSFWDNPEAAEIREKIPFNAVHVSIDPLLYRQILHFEAGLAECPGFRELASSAVITTCTLSAICSSMNDRLNREFAFARVPALESELCRQLAEGWFLTTGASDLSATELALRLRLGEIESEIKSAISSKCTDADLSDLPEYFYLDYLTSAGIAASTFDAVFPSPQSKRWALCIDELELAPAWLRNRLLAEMKFQSEVSVQDRSSPSSPLLPASLSDGLRERCKIVSLWPQGCEYPYKFCDRLVRSELERRMGFPG